MFAAIGLYWGPGAVDDISLDYSASSTFHIEPWSMTNTTKPVIMPRQDKCHIKEEMLSKGSHIARPCWHQIKEDLVQAHIPFQKKNKKSQFVVR